jgi:glycosyltransferase involved in cell wall biosynthesis
MRITFVLPTVNLSGGMRVAVIYAQKLLRMGHTVHVISPPPKPIPLSEKLKSWSNGHGWPRRQPEPTSHVDGAGLDHKILDRWRPVGDQDVPDGDIVIATWWETAEWVRALSPRKGAKVYFIQHHEIFPHLPISRCRATYRFPMHKIVVSQWLKQVLQLEYGDTVVDLVPNSFDKAQFFAPDRCKQTVPTVGFLYASPTFKGLDLTLEALRSTRERIPGLRMISFGSEHPLPELPLLEGTDFFYSPPQDKIRSLYSRCDAWITASRSEGFNLPAMEAMACRTPIVASRTGWPNEALRTAWNGVLVDIEDTVGLARGIEWILSQSNKDWKMLSSNAYATVAGTSWDQSAAMFLTALKRACRRAARGEIEGTCYSSSIS